LEDFSDTHSHLRVTMVISSLAAGGAQKVLSFLANHWAKSGWHVTIVTLSGRDQIPFFPLDPSVDILPLELEGKSAHVIDGAWNNIRRIVRLRRAILEQVPEVVISFMDQENILTTLAMWGLKIPVIISVRIDPILSPLASIWTLLRNQLYPHTDRIIVPTARIGAAFSQRIQSKTTVIPNPVFPATAVKNASRSPMPRTVVAVGRYTHQKGFDVLLRAFATLTTKYPEWRLHIFGDGPLRPDLEALRAELNLTSVVALKPEAKSINDVLISADMFVLSSRYEGFPNALCEAMATGLPVVATDCRTGPSEIIEDGVNGVLAKPNDVDSLAKCMDRLMSDDQQRQWLGTKARSITDRFDPKRIADRWEAVVRQVIRTAG
jgi:glycosyltransferase involved in cell wall biosynthesis